MTTPMTTREALAAFKQYTRAMNRLAGAASCWDRLPQDIRDEVAGVFRHEATIRDALDAAEANQARVAELEAELAQQRLLARNIGVTPTYRHADGTLCLNPDCEGLKPALETPAPTTPFDPNGNLAGVVAMHLKRRPPGEPKEGVS